jgi:hypothetical protein
VHRNKKERDRDILEKENGVWEKRKMHWKVRVIIILG